MPYSYSHFLFRIHCNTLIFQILCQEVLIVFGCFFPDKVTTETYNFVSLIVKIILLGSASVLSSPFAKETVISRFKFQFNLQLINSISSDLQKLLRYFNGTAIVALLEIPFAPSATVFPINLFSYLKDSKLLLLRILVLKLYSNELCIGLTKYKSSTSSIVIPSIFVIHLMNGAIKSFNSDITTY